MGVKGLYGLYGVPGLKSTGAGKVGILHGLN